MSAKRLLTIAVAAMVLIVGVAAVGAAGPSDEANENTPDDAPGEAPADAGPPTDRGPADAGPGDDRDDDASEDDDRDDAADADEQSDRGNAPDEAGEGVGPSGGLPEQVPDHVSEIHETIGSFLDGEIDNLGEALSDLLPGDDAGDGDDNADDADAEA